MFSGTDDCNGLISDAAFSMQDQAMGADRMPLRE